MDTDVLYFRIGGLEREYAQIEVVGNRGDGWLPSRATIRVGGFSAEYSCDLDNGALSCFAEELRKLHQTLQGVASLNSYEKQFELALVGDGLGHINVKGEAMDGAGTGNLLTFHLAIDQTQLLQLILEVDAIVAAHPARVAYH